MGYQNREFTSGVVTQDNNVWLGRSLPMEKLLLLLYQLDVMCLSNCPQNVYVHAHR